MVFFMRVMFDFFGTVQYNRVYLKRLLPLVKTINHKLSNGGKCHVQSFRRKMLL